MKRRYTNNLLLLGMYLILSAWTNNKNSVINYKTNIGYNSISVLINNRIAGKATLGISRKGNPVEAYYFPGISNKRALIIAGVHGSELSAIEIAKKLIEELQQGEQPYYSVVIIPCLFPDNAATAMRFQSKIGSHVNIGRYTNVLAADPNRQMPSLGKQFNYQAAYDHMGRVIEKENQLLLELISEFRPHRIANLHAIRDTAHAGIYADPRTDSRGTALGYETDSSLAIDMARYVNQTGGSVPGNCLTEGPTALYYKDPSIAPKGFLQKRNIPACVLMKGKGQGVSLGGWASTTIKDTNNLANNRDAIRLITVEFPGYKRPKDYETISQQNYCQQQVNVYAASIKTIFLGNYYTEEGKVNTTDTIVKK